MIKERLIKERPTTNLTEALNWYLENIPVTMLDGPWIATSDEHRGDGGKADDFKKNDSLYLQTMKEFYDSGYTKIIVGDKDDLWKFSKLERIIQAHQEAYDLGEQFKKEGRALRISGNHDRELGFPEALLLSWKGKKILFVHLYQGDLACDLHWKASRLLVKYFWANLEALGVEDPTTADIDAITARPVNPKKHFAVISEAKVWCRVHQDVILVGGHVHYADNVANYFNCGDWCAEEVGGQAVIGDGDGNISLQYIHP